MFQETLPCASQLKEMLTGTLTLPLDSVALKCALLPLVQVL